MDTQIDLRGLNRFMSQKVSYVYKRHPRFKHVNCFAVTKTMRGIAFFLKVLWMITFCQSYIFANKVSDTRGCYPVRPLAWEEVFISVIFQSFPSFSQISFYQFHNIGRNGEFACFVSFPMNSDSGSLSERYIANQYVAYLLCPCAGIIDANFAKKLH